MTYNFKIPDMIDKVIEFYPSGYRGNGPVCRSYAATQKAIDERRELIRTESMLHLSFGLIDIGYNPILVGSDGRRTKFYPGMVAPNGRQILRGHNIPKLLINGVLNDWL